MKKLIAVLALTVIMATSVLGIEFYSTDSEIIPGVVNMEPNDEVYVEYCVEKVYFDDGIEVGREAYVGLGVAIDTFCQDHNGVFGCQVSDGSTSVFDASTVDTETDADGCATLKLVTTDAFGGTFYYDVNGEEEGEVVTEETGVAYIPEFTTIGAGLMLLGAGLYAYRKRK